LSEYVNVNATAAELRITVPSLYKVVNHPDPEKRLEPVNRSTYKGDGGYMFRREDIERIKPSYVRNELTSAEAAKRIGRSTTYIHKLIKDGSLPFIEGEYRGKKTYFIKESVLEQFATCNPDNGKTDTIYDKKTGAFLFQPFTKDENIARVVKMKRVHKWKMEIVLQVGSGEFLSYEEAVQEGWTPQLTITSKKPITSFGFAVFEFPRPTTIDSMIFTIIEELFKQVGAGNIRITTGENLLVEVKKSVLLGIQPTTHPDLIDKLKLFIKSGEIIPKYDGTLIDTGLSPVTVYLPEQVKSKLSRKAEEAKMSLQDWVELRLSRE
jgi:hypothetical protein